MTDPNKDKVWSLLKLSLEERAASNRLADLPRQKEYMLSQAAEKAARAVVESEGIPVGTTHNFGQIAGLLSDDHLMKRIIADLDDMSSFSTRFRYPSNDRLKSPAQGTLEDATKRVQEFCDASRKFISSKNIPVPAPLKPNPKYDE